MPKSQSTQILINQNLNCEHEVAPMQTDQNIDDDADSESSVDNSCPPCNARVHMRDDQTEFSDATNGCNFNKESLVQSFFSLVASE